MKKIYLLFTILLLLCSSISFSQSISEANFLSPPSKYQTYSNYRWLNGNISKEGITKDLEEIKAKGMQGIMFFNISGPYPKGDVIFMSDEWKALFKFMVDECARLGLSFSFHHCDGWGASGGPWVKKEDAMKRVVASKMNIEGGKKIEIRLPQPHTRLDYYEDINVYAFPTIDTGKYKFTLDNLILNMPGWQIAPETLIDGDRYTTCNFGYKDGDEHVIDFENPFLLPVSAINVYHGQREHPVGPKECELLYSNDSIHFTSIGTFTLDDIKGGFSFSPIKAKYLRLKINKFTRGSGWVFISEIELLSPGSITNFPKLEDFELKTCTWKRRRNFKNNQNFPEEQLIMLDEIIDLTDHFKDGQLLWDAPEGNWTIARIGYTLTGRRNGPATKEGVGLECDKFNIGSIRRFYDGYTKILLDLIDEHKEKTIKYVHGDSFEAEGQNWTQDFKAEFKKYRDYDIDKWLLVLSGEIVESVEKSDAFLHDLRMTVSDLMANNYYTTLTELAHENGVHFRAQVAGGQQLAINPSYYGTKVDQIDTEFWVNHTDSGSFFKYNGQTLDAISTAQIYGQNVMGAESFTCMIGDFRSTPQVLKRIGDEAFCWGLNDFEFHAYIHQPGEMYPGWQHFPWGTAFTRKLTWWNQSIPWQIYLQRCNYLLQQGQPVVDFLVFTGDQIPASLDYTYEAANPTEIVPNGYKLNALGKYTLMHDIRVENGLLTAPSGLQYKMLILPDKAKMEPQLLQKIEELILQGAVVYGNKPIGVPGLMQDKEKFNTLVNKLWQEDKMELSYGKGTIISGVELEKAIEMAKIDKDFFCKKSSGRILFNHKIMEDGTDIYFVSNQEDEAQTILASFRIKNKIPEVWNAIDGSQKNAFTYFHEGNRTLAAFDLPAHGSAFVIFRKHSAQGMASIEVEESDPIIIEGAWEATFANTNFGTPKKVSFKQLESWSLHKNDAVKYYSGTVNFTNELELTEEFISNNKSIYLEIEKVFALADVMINGQTAGTIWTPPYQVDISELVKAGINKIEIRATNTWANRLIGDVVNNENYTQMPCFGSYDGSGKCQTFYKADSKLPESGVAGHVIIFGIRNN